MKAIKKFACLLLAMVMILSLGITAFADEGTGTEKNDSITINNAKVGETYKLYKLLDLSVNSETNPNAYSYTVVPAWADFFAGDGKDYITVNDAGYVTAISDAAALAKAAAEWTSKPAATKSVTVAENADTAVFDGLEDGYWLVTSTLGTIAMAETTPAAAAVTITEKNQLSSIAKKVQEEDGDYKETNDAQVGDMINFKSTLTIVKGARNVVVHDQMTSGLTSKNDVKIYTDEACTTELAATDNYAITYNVKHNEGKDNEYTDTFDISFADTYVNGLTAATTTLYITYSATLNENAVTVTTTGEGEETVTTVALAAQTNTTNVSFGDATKSENDTTTTTTHKFSVYKHAAGSTDNLAGAVFSLKKGDGVVKLIKIDATNYRVAMDGESGAVETFATVATGDTVIWGVDADSDYTLVETEAPAGYNKLTDPVSVTVGADNATRIDVENKSGTELPSTGGIGTTLFYVIGGVLMLTAVVLLVTKKRMSVAE